MTMPTSWGDFPSHAGVPKLIPNPLAVDNVSAKNIPVLLILMSHFGGGGGIFTFHWCKADILEVTVLIIEVK